MNSGLKVLGTIVPIIVGLITIYQFAFNKTINSNTEQIIDKTENKTSADKYISKPLEEILSSLKGKTDIQAQQIVKELYIGKLIKDSFKVVDVSEGKQGIYLSLKPSQSTSIGFTVHAYFDFSKRDMLMQLKEGDLVKVEGEIDSMDRLFGVVIVNPIIQDFDISR